MSFFANQLAWGDRLSALGVSPPRLRYQTITPTALANSIEQAVCDLEMRRQVQALGKAMQQESGDEAAVNLIEDYLKRLECPP